MYARRKLLDHLERVREAELADFKTWLAGAVAELQRKHNVNPSIIPIRVWRHLYIQGRTPHDAADKAAVPPTTRGRLPIG
jgi:hypothetical protein